MNGISETVLIRFAVVLIILLGIVILVWIREKREGALAADNAEHPLRFFALFGIFTLISGISAFSPELIFPGAGLCLVLACFSDLTVGVACCFVIHAVPLLLMEKSFEYFLLEVLTSMLMMILLLHGNQKRRIAEPLAVYSLSYVTLYTALIILKRLSIVPALILNPAISLVLSLVIGGMTVYTIRKGIEEREGALERVADPEFPLLLRLKAEDAGEYKKAIHSAYLCDRIGDRMGLNRILLKGAGFYHAIGVISPDEGEIAERTRGLLQAAEFPEELIDLISEFYDDGRDPVSGEAIVLSLSHTVVSEILGKAAEGEEKINYNKVIDQAINKMLAKTGGILQRSSLEIRELYRVRKYLKEEKLYYDFLH